MRLRLLALGAVLVMVWPALASWAQTNQVALDKFGWWNVNQALPADPTGGLLPPSITVPAPPTAPPEGLYVEQGPNGVAAIAAVSYYTGGDVDASLTLELADSAAATTATLAACPAGGGWDPAQNGRWDRRPPYDPANCKFLGTVHPDTVTFAIPAAAHETGSAFLSVVIVPAEGSGIFNVGFKPPTAASLVTSAPPPSEAPPSASPARDFAPLPVTFGGDAYAPPTFVAPAPTATTAPPAAAPRRAAARLPDDSPQTSDRVVAVALLLAGALVFLPRRWLPFAMGNGTTRGLGRFARDRAAPPNRI